MKESLWQSVSRQQTPAQFDQPSSQAQGDLALIPAGAEICRVLPVSVLAGIGHLLANIKFEKNQQA